MVHLLGFVCSNILSHTFVASHSCKITMNTWDVSSTNACEDRQPVLPAHARQHPWPAQALLKLDEAQSNMCKCKYKSWYELFPSNNVG